MLTSDEQDYLNGLTETQANRIVHIQPYNRALADTAEAVIQRLQDQIPNTDIQFMGASALGISGQNDIDIYVLAPTPEHSKYFPVLDLLLGKQDKHKWHWVENDYEVSVYLADPQTPTQKKQIDVFNTLKKTPGLLKEYEQLKSSMDGKTYKEYQTVKYEFYHKILSK